MPVVPIGMPIRDMFFLVVDLDTISEYSTTSSSHSTQRPQLVTDGSQEGELWIGGIGVGLGYLNRPDLTEAVYLPNPFGEGMIYRTGDLVKRLENGIGPYHFIRRIDNQVKVDGFRIELSEIEYVFLTHSLVQQCVVLLKKNVLVLYVKNQRQNVHGELHTWLTPHEIGEIKDHAARSLTYYMIPKIVIQVNKFEETPSGKINRNVLPEPDDVEPHLVDYSGIGGTTVNGGSGGDGSGVNGDGKGVNSLSKVEVDEVDIREKQSKPDHVRHPLPTTNDRHLHHNIQHNDHNHGTGTGTVLPKLGDQKNGEKSTMSGRALTKHILDIIERVRGHWCGFFGGCYVYQTGKTPFLPFFPFLSLHAFLPPPIPSFLSSYSFLSPPAPFLPLLPHPSSSPSPLPLPAIYVPQLSDSLGGHRVQPKDLYKPGMLYGLG